MTVRSDNARSIELLIDLGLIKFEAASIILELDELKLLSEDSKSKLNSILKVAPVL